MTLSTALSMAIVPVVALALATVLGEGVELIVAIASPLIVLGSGLVVYIWFGQAKEPDEPLASTPAPLGIASLGLLASALALVLGSDLADPGTFWRATSCQGWPSVPCEESGIVQTFMLPVALLLLAAGFAKALASRREQEIHAREPPAADQISPANTPVRRLLLPAVLLLVLARGYLGPVLHDWPFIRGLDHYSHAIMTDLIMSRSTSESYLIYPPGFHTLTAVISRLNGLEPLEIFPVLGPALLLLPALASYTLARRLWGYEYGIAAAFLAGVLMGGSYYYFNDAMYPNLVTSQFLMVLAVAALLRVYHSPSVRGGILLALLGSSVVFYHQVSSMYLALLLAVVALLLLPYLLLRDRRRGISLLLSLTLLGLLSTTYAWGTYDVGRVISGFLGGSETGTTASAVDMALGTQNIFGLDYLIGAIVSQPVAWLGLFGAVLMVAGFRRPALPESLAWATLVAWALILFVGSRTSYSGFPQRFGRDLGIPLALLGALTLVTVLRSLSTQRKPVEIVTAAVAVLLAGSLIGLRAVQSLDQATSPSPHVTITPRIAAAGEWLEGHNTGGNIIVSPQHNQVPSRMMLAMGHYSALQSFTANQVNHPRDLPPYGKEPLQDVLWTMRHPVGARTEHIFDEYDVRYVALYKHMPDRTVIPWWMSFEARHDAYQNVFENRDVLIVKPR